MQGYVFNLLKVNPNGTTNILGEYISFSQDGFHPPIYLTVPNTNEQENENKILATIHFNSPQSGDAFLAGSTIDIGINGSAGIQRFIFANKNGNTELYAEEQQGSSTDFQFTIPNEAIGAMRMVAIGFDADSNYVAIDTVTINVQPNATPINISSIYPTEKIFIPKYTEHTLTIKAMFSDGIEREVSNLAGLEYSLPNLNMLREGWNKTIVGVNVGTTQFSVRYQNTPWVAVDAEIFESEYTNIGFTLQQNNIQPSCASSATGSASIYAVESDTYTYQWSNGDNTSTAYNLSPGVYTCTVTNPYNTQREIEVEIPEARLINSVHYDMPTCDNPNTVASVLTVDDPSFYYFTWNFGQSDIGFNTITMLPNSEYYVTVTDTQTGCDAFQMVSSQDNNIQLIDNIAVQQPKCYGQAGQASVNVLGNANNYLYQWSNNANTQTVANLPQGIYTVTVTYRNNNQCNTTQEITINDAPSLINSSSVRFIECATRAQGRILVDLAPCNCTYKWEDDVTTLNRYNLGVGLHTLSITNRTEGCVEEKKFTIGINNDLVATQKITHDLMCTPNTDDGAVEFTSSGTPPYKITLNSAIQRDSLFINYLRAGNYLAKIVDANGCKTLRSFYIGGQDCDDLDFLVTVFPNPLQNDAIISYQINEDNNSIGLNLFNALGQNVSSTILSGKRGTNQFALNNLIGNLSNGVYYIHFYIGEKDDERKMIKVIKMD